MPPKTLAILPQCGIGDLIQHLWYLRPIAARARDGKLTLMIKTRSMAKEWIDEEPWIESIEYLERKDLYKRAMTLRREKYEEAWVFHRSFSHAFFTYLAGIPKRFGPGYGRQAWCLTNPPLPQRLQQLPHLSLMSETIKQQGLPLDFNNQRLPLKERACLNIKEAYKNLPKPLITLGIGASEAFKKWPLTSFLEVAKYLKTKGPVTFLLSGGMNDKEDAHKLGALLEENAIPFIIAIHLPIAETFALLRHTHLYIGNDTSLLNASAALGIPTIGLFGATPPLDFSPHILPVYPHPHTIESIRGMLAITPQHVINVLELKK